MIKCCTLLLFCFIVSTSWGQKAYLKNTSNQVLFEIVDGNVFDKNGTQIYSLKGNILFEGVSDKKKDIVLLIQSTDIFASKLGKGLSADLKQTYFSIYRGEFYLEEYPYDDALYKLGTVKANDDGYFTVTGPNDSIAGYIYGETQTSSVFATLFYLLMTEKDWTAVVRNKLPVLQVYGNAASTGTMRRTWNTGEDEFIWDGTTLKRRFNSYDYEEWTFDGFTLKRSWYEGGAEYTWDGEVLKPNWRNTNDEIVWDGRVLKRRWSAGDDEYVVQGNIVKKQWDSTGNDEWEIDGTIPIPVIAIIVFDLLRK